ncbi:MAG: dephospho-CoA kinase [Bacteroidota bacterium]
MNRLQIGVTGGIGSGKSLVCNIFAVLGIPIYNADSRARWLMNNQQELKESIIEHFGQGAYDPGGALSRDYIARLVFNDPEELKKLNSLVHPAVGKDYAQWFPNQKADYTIKEAALMFESGSYKGLDYVINVSAPVEKRVLRVLKRDTFRSENEVRAIIEKQLPEFERIEKSDFVITNDDQQMIIPQILGLNQRFSRK